MVGVEENGRVEGEGGGRGRGRVGGEEEVSRREKQREG